MVVAWLLIAGDHVPGICSFEYAGSAAILLPVQVGATCVNVGVTGAVHGSAHRTDLVLITVEEPQELSLCRKYLTTPDVFPEDHTTGVVPETSRVLPSAEVIVR